MKQLKSQRHWSWMPFILQLLFTLLVSALYFTGVDWDWYQQQFVLPSMQDLSPSELEVVLQFSSPSTFIMSSVLGALLFTPLLVAGYAFYLSKMTQMDDDNIQGFTDWYGLCWWMQLPLIGSAIVGMALILISGNQLDPTKALAPLSLANLINFNVESAWYNLASSVSLVGIWVAILQYKGIRAWTKLEPLMALIIIGLPYFVIYGIWIWMI